MINEEEQGTDQEELFSSDTSLVTRSVSRKTKDKNKSRKELCSAPKGGKREELHDKGQSPARREAESDIDLEQGQDKQHSCAPFQGEEDNPGPIAKNYTHNRALDTLIPGSKSDAST